MSEDCHDSNNEQTPDHIVIPCAECGEPVQPEEAFPCELSHVDGTFEIAVFHKSLDRMCAFKWSLKKLAAASDKLEAILDLWKTVKEPDASSGL